MNEYKGRPEAAQVLFDFGAFLTSSKRQWVFSSHDDAAPMVLAIRAFALGKGIDLDAVELVVNDSYESFEEGYNAGRAGGINRPELHPATADLVMRFADAMREKLAAAEVKYGYSDGWASDDWMDECRAKLMEHIAKGDPMDVAAYCAFLWHHGESTTTPDDEAERDSMFTPAHADFERRQIFAGPSFLAAAKRVFEVMGHDHQIEWDDCTSAQKEFYVCVAQAAIAESKG